MKCETPLKIRNKYTGQWMVVPCRKCDCCRISDANKKALFLQEDFRKHPFGLFVTLTYNNESLPYVIPDCKIVFRGSFPPHRVGFFTDKFSFRGSVRPSGFGFDSCGVLLYRDLQLFLKRLRKSLSKNGTTKDFKWKFSAIGEYGSRTKRPHFHILFYGNTEFPEYFRSAIVENWKFCTWSKLDLDECIKDAVFGIADYLASYVNCLSGRDGFEPPKVFRQKTLRSKDINFGIAKEVENTFQKCDGERVFDLVCAQGPGAFRRVQHEKLGCVSSFLLPDKLLSATYVFPVGSGRYSFSDFRRCCGQSYAKIYATPERERSRKLDDGDYRFWLAYKRWLKGRKDTVNLFDLYVLENYRCWSAYNSAALRLGMEKYDYRNPIAYYESLINTKLDNDFARQLFLQVHGSSLRYDNFVTPENVNLLSKYHDDYYRKLLPKHLNDYAFNLSKT